MRNPARLSALGLALGLALGPAARAREEANVPLLNHDECWQRLPPVALGGGGPVPSWARGVAVHLPRTAAALLELDLAQRTKGPLDPRLRAAMRWVAARENRCAYAELTALFDARRAGLDDGKLDALRRGDHSGMTAAEQRALEFARKMTVASASISDAEFAGLVQEFGAQKAAAMVLLMAYANFQDRLLLCLGVSSEPGGPMPPLEVKFVSGSLASKTTPPPPISVTPLPKPTGRDLIADDPDWTSLSYEALQERLERQRNRPTRLRIPSWEEVEQGLPPGFATRPSRIVWNRICLGYVPDLAAPWETLMMTHGAENGPAWDRILSGSLFWVVTRAIDCPYCMGHCEMNWEVAGLPLPLIAERSRFLAGDDWSSFPPAEQRAFAFARQLTRAPRTITIEDVKGLESDFGPSLALSIMVYVARCNYMTRISNGFQLTLERDNVFYEYYNVPPPVGARSADLGPPGSHR